MAILVTGARGMLGFDLCNSLRMHGHQVVEWDLPEHDITDVHPTISDVVKLKPEAIFHLAAFTDVDGAEAHRAEAYKVNTMGTWTIAIAARDSGAELVYVSTDYVFDGTKETPYVENDKTNPLNYYGMTKLLGEHAVVRETKKHYICRTSWLYGKHGRNFVDTIVRLARLKPCLEVVNDQHGAPTYTRDLAPALLEFIGSRRYGIYHLTNSGQCTWFDFAREIVGRAGLMAEVKPTTSDRYVRPAKRPPFSKLDTGLYEITFQRVVRPWQEGLQAYLEEQGLLHG
jgi:dTDP-4-dehydrorhamnose reductase